MTNSKLTASRFLPECLKPEEISGDKREPRLNELMNWFDRYYNGQANPKWFKSHVAELCYYILSESEPQERRKPQKPVVTFYSEGIAAAANWVDQQRESYDNEHGRRDNDTGSFEFGNDAQRDYSDTLAEIAEGIRALHPSTSGGEQETRVTAGGRFTKFNHPELGATIAVDGEPLSMECVVNSLNTMQAELQRRKAAAEPVAYRKFVKDDCNSLLDGYEYFDSQGKSGSREPLYAAPQPAPIDIDRLQESAYKAGLTAGWNFGIEHNSGGFSKCLAAHEYAAPQLSGITEQLNQAPVKQPASKCPKCGDRGTYYDSQMRGSVFCDHVLKLVSAPYKLPPNSFTDGDLEAMAHGDNPQSNAYRELLAFRRNSPVTPDCWCHTCRSVTMNDMRFVVCPDCGNKRCPRANDHRNACTGSNELGQEGSAYPAAPQQEVK
jgi:predicted RNA-binding Zn-ribbon protein involved in translation (DUF1610 family)